MTTEKPHSSAILRYVFRCLEFGSYNNASYKDYHFRNPQFSVLKSARNELT